MSDLAIIGQDPGFAGGGRAQTEALWRAAITLGRKPELHYLRYRRLDRLRTGTVLEGRGVPPVVPGLDVANVLGAAVLISGRVRGARARFVCTATASHGFGAVLARKPYACWISTSLSDEGKARRQGLDGPRRVAHATSAPGLRVLERATLRGATVRWTISAAARQALAAAADLPESEIRVVAIPIDTEQFTPLPDDEWVRGLQNPELIFVGRADDPRKNIELLLEGFTRVRASLPDAKLTLVGTAPQRALPPGVEAVGTVDAVADRLRRAALFVLPSLQEGFGIVVAEALAAGVPVLVTPCGGPEELVRSSQGGEILSGFDPEDMAERATALLTDERRLSEMRRRGREYVVREHGPSTLLAALADALQTLDHAG